jgi:hypothetical protein
MALSGEYTRGYVPHIFILILRHLKAECGKARRLSYIPIYILEKLRLNFEALESYHYE